MTRLAGKQIQPEEKHKSHTQAKREAAAAKKEAKAQKGVHQKKDRSRPAAA